MAEQPTHCANFDENVEQALIGTSHNRCVYGRDVVIVCVRPAFSQQEGDRQLLPVHEELLLQIAHCGECW